jgi:hypothetical protein
VRGLDHEILVDELVVEGLADPLVGAGEVVGLTVGGS